MRNYTACSRPLGWGKVQRLAVAAPRGSAKSTLISLFYVLWLICTGRAKFVLLVSDTKEKAHEFLHHIRDELQENERLRTDYPHVCELPGERAAPRRWKAGALETRNGALISAAGAGQSLRGRRYKEHRPDCVILDDLENDDNVATADARGKLRGWFERTLLKCGAPATNVVMVGTIQHMDSLLAHLTSEAMSIAWKSRIYRSVIQWSPRSDLWARWAKILHRQEEYNDDSGIEAADAYLGDHREAMLEGTKVLWPEREDYIFLMKQRETEGEWAFNAEKQNDPSSPEDCYFNPDEFVFWDDRYDSPEHLLECLKTARTSMHGDSCLRSQFGQTGKASRLLGDHRADSRQHASYQLCCGCGYQQAEAGSNSR